MVNTTWLFAC